MAKLTVKAVSSTEIRASITGMSGSHPRTRYFYWYANGEKIDTTTCEPNATSHAVTLAGLEPGTEYVISVEIRDVPSTNYAIMAELEADPVETEAEAEQPIEAWYTCGATQTEIEFTIYDLYAGQYGFCYVKDSSGTLLWGSSDDKSYFEATRDGQSKTVTLGGLEAGKTYTVNVEVYTSSGASTLLGQDTVKTSSIDWPGDWGWWSEKTAWQPVKIRANEWAHFVERINEIRAYKGKGPYNFTEVEPYDPISTTVCLEAYEAIYEIADADDMPDRPLDGYPMKASFFNDLRDALNAVE